jgi:hypothetical protein
MDETRDWEDSARARLERTIAATVDQLRRVADEIERDTKYQIEAAAGDATDYSSYARAAQTVVHALTWGVANTNLSNVIDAAADADRAHQQGAR